MRAFGFGAEDPVCLDVEHYTDVYDDPLVPQDFWAYHQRITQYEGDHEESHGGVPLTMDSDVVDGPVVSPATPDAPPLADESLRRCAVSAHRGIGYQIRDDLWTDGD